MANNVEPEPILFTMVGNGRVQVSYFPKKIVISANILAVTDPKVAQKIELDTAIFFRAVNGWARYNIIEYNEFLHHFVAVCSIAHMDYIPAARSI